MAIYPGTRLGPYEVLSPLGAGGMGEVYRARDTRLGREVAVKVLPPRLSDDPDVKARFEREARAISQLSHPNICALFDVGSVDGVAYLVMELLEGPTLADRLGKGPLPADQVMRYGAEIAGALDRAHRAGIVHRDLKPANVMLTKSGVKLLDFGLAKAAAPERDGSISSLPTEADRPLTEKGTILGTFQYMAPEQVEGKEADARTDLFALGAVLHEMATGKKAFTGASRASLVGAIMATEPPPISKLQPTTPPSLDHVVGRCLAKDPDERWQSAADVASELRWIAKSPPQAAAHAPATAPERSHEWLAWAALAIVAVGAGFFASGSLRRPPVPAPVIRTSLPTPAKLFVFDLALSPDGEKLAFAASKLGLPTSLWVRSLDGAAAQAIPGTEDGFQPFWSPDGRSIAFFAGGKLKKVEIGGGPVLTICSAEDSRGGTWNRDGTIVFSPGPASGLYRVAASGGPPSPVTRLAEARHETSHRYPFFLPDGRHFLYTAANHATSPSHADNGVRLASLDGKVDRAVVQTDSSAIYAAGVLAYDREGALLLRRFDPDRLEVQGEPVAAARSAWRPPFAASGATISGRLLICSSTSDVPSQLLWFDRGGKQVGSLGESRLHQSPRISPDGRQVAVTVTDPGKGQAEIWILDASTGSGKKFAFGAEDSFWPVWSPDGSRIAFSSRRKSKGGHADIWIKSLDGSREEIFAESDDRYVQDWSRDGRRISFSGVTKAEGKRTTQVWAASLPDGKDAAPVSTEDSFSGGSRFSPDGRWLAFESDESGRLEVYVRPFPGPGAKQQVSVSGGGLPRWRGDGRELYFLNLDNRVMAASVSLSPLFRAGPPVSLFTVHPNPSGLPFDVAADGQRFLVDSVPADEGSPPLNVILNWNSLLGRR